MAYNQRAPTFKVNWAFLMAVAAGCFCWLLLILGIGFLAFGQP